jgi:glycosyltransferase involved in cell wall biosynthesis
MKKMLYIGHNYHLKTKSTQFLYEIFEKKYEITYVTFNPYTNAYEGVEEARKTRYDALVILQVTPEMSFLTENFVFKQGVFIPMYDYIATQGYDRWTEYRTFKIICFSSTLHRELLERGYRSYYIQYFPKPFQSVDYGSPKSVFFWQRLEMININTVMDLMKDINIDHIHIHKSLDPNQKFIEPSRQQKIEISYSEWLENASDMQTIMQRSAFYIAPRLYEGIGMSFLEAMAMGRCVIAPNMPTMNEYIENGVNGILYDLEQIHPIKIKDIREIQKNAEKYIVNGYNNWEEKKDNILKWIEEEHEQPLVTVVTVEKDIIKNGRKSMFQQCIESVHNQLYPHIQHLIIDGNSQDGTINLLERYKKLGWIEYISEPDTGMYEAMNKGIKNAKGKYIVFLNTDDFFHNPDAIWESVFSLENSQADFSFASNRILSEDEKNIVIRKPEIGSFIAQMPFCHQTMFAKKDMLVSIGMFNEKYKSAADYDLVLRVILAGYKYVEVETDIVTYRRGGVSESVQQRSDEEKRDIFKQLYSQIYGEVLSEDISKCIAGRMCPKKLFDNMKTAVPEALREDMERAILTYDEKKQIYYLPEEIITCEFQMNGGKNVYKMDYSERAVTAKNMIERIDKFMKYFALLDRWLWLKLQNKNISSYFEKQGFQNIAIYGMGEIGNRLFEELSRFSSIKVKYAIDKNRKESQAVPVLSIDEELPEVDAIIVTNNYIYNQIQELLRGKTVSPIVSIDDVIFSIK